MQTVTLAGTGSAVVTPAANPNVTNASGVVTFTATDPNSETVTFTATDTTESTVIANTASVTFGTLTVSASQSTVTTTSPAPLGASGTTVVVTLLTSTNSPVEGKTVSLSSTGSAVVGAPTPATTGSNGQVSFLLNGFGRGDRDPDGNRHNGQRPPHIDANRDIRDSITVSVRLHGDHFGDNLPGRW